MNAMISARQGRSVYVQRTNPCCNAVVFKRTVFNDKGMEHVYMVGRLHRDGFAVGGNPVVFSRSPTFCRSSSFSKSQQDVQVDHESQKTDVAVENNVSSSRGSPPVSDGDESGEPSGAEWDTCCSKVVQELGVDEEQAYKVIKQAFGWSTQAYWRGEKVKETPDIEKIESSLEFLSTIGIDGPGDRKTVVEKFPEVLSVDRELMIENVKKLEEKYFLKGKGLSMSVKRKPRVIPITYSIRRLNYIISCLLVFFACTLAHVHRVYLWVDTHKFPETNISLIFPVSVGSGSNC